MNRREFFRAAGLGAGSMAALRAQRQTRPPNFVFLLADDLGYGDVNLGLKGVEAFRNPFIRTPNLERLARESLVFTHHYSSSPVCSPSRAGLLTGRTPTRSTVDLWINDRRDNDRMFLSGKEVTIPEVLKKAGYQSAVFGKWHLNGADWEKKENWTGWTGSFPLQQGFDAALITKENAHETRALAKNSQRNPGDFFHGDGTPAGTLEGHSSSIAVDHALDWIRNKRDRSRPFFLYLPFDAVHEIVMSPPKFERMYNTGDADKDKFYANVTYLDHEVGRFVRALDELGLGKQTIVFFSSDNGPDTMKFIELTARSYGTSYPLRGQKRQVWEGGIRVPGMVRWPGRIRPGVSDYPNATLDLLPTLAELAGVAPPEGLELDGMSIAPHLLSGARPERRSPLYWHFEKAAITWETTGEGYNRRYDGTKQLRGAPVPHVAIRSGDYVLLGFDNEEMYSLPKRYELYDVMKDPAQKNEMSKKRPEVFRKMIAALERKHASVMRDRAARAKEIADRVDQRS